MMNHIVDSYENSREEDRLTTNNARRIEYLTTIRAFDDLFAPGLKILDCAAGTGIYAFYLAEKGHKVTATDITPRHIELINKDLETKEYKMETAVLDATDLSIFADDYFDVVLNMGPFYHLVDDESREKCMSECLRVLKKGGLLASAYISRYFVFPYVAMSDKQYLKAELASQLYETGVLTHDDPNCFWTDSYYASPEEMESCYKSNSLEIIDHFAQDGILPMLKESVDKWDEEQLKTWCEYHYRTCREKSTIGASNHILIVGKK